MHCKYLKLTNGENIIVTTDDACTALKEKEFISVVDPVVLNSYKFSRGPYVVESYVMEPWIKVAKEDVYQIPTSSIVIAVDVDEDASTYYKKFLSERSSKETMFKSGEETKQLMEEVEAEELENDFVDIMTNYQEDETDDDDGTDYVRNGRVIH